MISKVICRLAVIPLRKEASDRSEMVSQVLYGETMELLEAGEKWLLVKLDHDGYEGWVDKKQVVQMEGELSVSKAVCVNNLFEYYDSVDSSLILPAGALVNSSFKLSRKLGASHETTSDITTVGAVAKMFLEAPYLWGGRTFMGIDCSGFSQVVFRLMGINILRDAYQQAEQGELVSFAEESQTGDLAFFENSEGKITHVGIVLREKDGDLKIIHASGKVRIDRLDHLGIFNEETNTYTHSLRIIKRHQL